MILKLTRVCESSTQDLCVLPLQICKVNCDWFLSIDVTEIVLVARVRRDNRQPEIRLRLQARLPWASCRFRSGPHVQPIHALVHHQPISKLDSIKKALDAYETTGQLVRVSQPTDWISNMVIREREPTPHQTGKNLNMLGPFPDP